MIGSCNTSQIHTETEVALQECFCGPFCLGDAACDLEHVFSDLGNTFWPPDYSNATRAATVPLLKPETYREFDAARFNMLAGAGSSYKYRPRMRDYCAASMTAGCTALLGPK